MIKIEKILVCKDRFIAWWQRIHVTRLKTEQIATTKQKKTVTTDKNK